MNSEIGACVVSDVAKLDTEVWGAGISVVVVGVSDLAVVVSLTGEGDSNIVVASDVVGGEVVVVVVVVVVIGCEVVVVSGLGGTLEISTHPFGGVIGDQTSEIFQ